MIKNHLPSRRCGFDPWVGKIPWRRKWLPTAVCLPGKAHGRRNLIDYSPWDHKRVRHNLATEHSSKQHHKPDTGVNTKDIMVTK